jgi:ribosomal protein S18 acetylase RimI-like enzyme
MSPVEVRPADEGDVDALVGVLSRAFSTDPPMSWAFRDESTRTERLATMFGAAMPSLFLPAGHVWTTSEVAGAAVWQPPGQWRTPDDKVGELLEQYDGKIQPDELDRFLTFLGMIEDKHPDDPEHWYLEVLAADVDRQGQGIGSACMQPILERADAEQMPAYLESSNIKNVPLYERNGFKVVDVVDLPDDGPSLWLMWRDPQPTASGTNAS